jgi:hypothetical protein
MLPRQAYDHARNRASNLLLLHDGLTNRRHRGIRKDWKRSFCQMMHWRRDSDIQRIDSKDAVIILRDGCVLTVGHFEAVALEELLRSALVLCVSALDRYMHERIVKKIIVALRSGRLSKEQSEFMIPAVDALRITQKVVKARRQGKAVRPANEIRIVLQELLHKRTFQSWRELEEGFKLIGINGLAGHLQVLYGVGNMKPIQMELNQIARKRNRIVHEADLVLHKRGGKARLHPITAADVRHAMTFLDDLVQNLESIT